MASGNFPGNLDGSGGYGFLHELDDYINSFAEEDQFSQFFDAAYYNASGETAGNPSQPTEDVQTAPYVPDFLIDPQLRAEPGIACEQPQLYAPPLSATPNYFVAAAPGYSLPPQHQASVELSTSQGSSNSPPARKLRRKSKKEESTHNHYAQAKYPLFDHRLYELAKKHGTPIKCPPPMSTQDAGYFAAPGFGADFGEIPPEISQRQIDEFLASLENTSQNQSMEDIIALDAPLAGTQEVPTINQQQFTLRMLTPSAPLVQPSEKRKRGRPKKDEVDESHQEPTPQVQYPFSFQAPIQFPQPSPQSVPQPLTSSKLQLPTQFRFPPPAVAAPVPVMNPSSFPQRVQPGFVVQPEASSSRPIASIGQRRVETKNSHRSMSKKEQAYLEMDSTVKLYDASNIHELLYYPSVKPGRTPCLWVQRHPYANTRIYEDHYRTWCRYRHCKGVETAELIRTASGEMREKNYKHPRTIIAGNYQIAVDWEYVMDEIAAFKGDPDGQYEYDKRNVYDTIECFFHLRCFEQMVDFPQVVRTHLVQVDHRVLNKDKSRNKITKRKNKGGTNAAEIEWYLKEDAEHWMQKTQLDWTFNPLPGSEESLEKVLLNGKKQYNEKKGHKYIYATGSEFGSPAPSEM
ncbi:hypothetical protein TWF730_010475 [Orbilia blumenaviensis]|uniref:Uncharacterized protein n=1 Tax=Orbilia blumenaviensis TaxID=1796055 RepID=A0AAV9USV1_9PEZI